MEELLIDIIYDKINNEEQLKGAEIEEITNILNEKVINVKVGKEYYTISCNKTFVERG